MNKEEIRVKIDEKLQKAIFTSFIKEFKGDFGEASRYLDITKSSLSKYKRGVVRHIPNKVLLKVVDYLKIEKPEIIYSGNIRKIRSDYMKKAHPVLNKKYGSNWAKELTKKRDFKGISLGDFSEETFVFLEENYRKELLESAYFLFGALTKLAKKINISPTRLSYWFVGKQKDYKTNKIGLQFIPLSKLKLISKYLVEDSREEFSMEKIEKKVLMYRMQSGNPIKNPKFPIKKSPQLTRLLFHLLGDGYAGKKGENAGYRNTCTELLEEFKGDLKIFGDVPVYEQEYSIKFPRVLAKVMEDFYEVNCGCYDSYISKKILQISKNNLCSGIRAFTDDEGSVYSHSIRITSANFNLLNGIKEILGFLKIRTNEVKFQFNPKTRYGRVYYLDICDLERYRKIVGFTHPKKKELLESYVRRIKRVRRKKLLKT
jgi:hypothetical protein